MAHFDWFLSLFQISYVKPELSPVELKVGKNGIFWAKNLFQKKFSEVIFVPQSKLCHKVGSKWPQNWFLEGGAESAPPPATWDAFQMLPQVGLDVRQLILE